MKKLYKSEITGKVYESEGECMEAEKAHAALIAKEAKGKAERKALADSIKDAYSNYVSLREANKKSEAESYNKYLKLRNEFVDKYGSYHLTLTQTDDLKPPLSVGVDSIRDLINSCFGSDFWSF